MRLHENSGSLLDVCNDMDTVEMCIKYEGKNVCKIGYVNKDVAKRDV